MERKCSLQDEEGPSTSTAEVAANRTIQEQSLEEEEELEMKTEEFEELHMAIEEGDIESVRSIVQCHAEERYFSFEDISALYLAFQCKEYNIISLLIHRGAKFAGSEEKYVHTCGVDLDLVNHILYDYNRKSDKACVYRLMSLSQSPQGLDGDRLNAVKFMYEHLFRSDIIKLLLKVLESVDFDIVFDFESDTVNRVHRLDEAEAEIFGLTLSILREIFIGGEGLLSNDPKKKAKVYGVVAEELCHLALMTVFQNDAKPYKKEDSKLISEFHDIVRAVKSLVDRSSKIESVIVDVFGYPYGAWECELIARVPHVIGIYGEKLGREKFEESSELTWLLNFYDKNVHERCKVFCDPSLNTKSGRIRKQLMGKNEFISFREKQIRPLIDDYPSFREYVVAEEGVSVISTNCIKLSILHVYHELKPVCGDQFERKCLFFSSECFEKNSDEILNAFKCNLFEYLVLVLVDKELHHRRLLCEYLDHFQEFKNKGLNIIIISNSQFLRSEFKKTVEYKWDDLTDAYKDLRTHPMEYMFKGERKYIFIKKEDVPKFFREEDIFHLISGDLIEVRDGADLNSQGYNLETYVERQFEATVIDKNIFKSLPKDSSFLIYGLKYLDSKLSINERLVQWLKGSEVKLQEGKAIFINYGERNMNFKDFVKETAAKNRICLKFYKEVFYLMDSEGDVWKPHKKRIRQTEGEIIDWLKNNKTLIISDNAGCGKSTVMCRLIWLVRKDIYNSWVLSVNLSDFSMDDEITDSEEEMFAYIYQMLGLENGFQKCHFKDTKNPENYFIFLDALDEIQSMYKTKALRLIAFLREKTDARIIITTRTHHQKELEEILNAFSHQLVPFDNESQVHCLGQLLHWKLKFPRGEESILPQKDKKAISEKIKIIIEELEKGKDNFNSHDLILAMQDIKSEDSLDSIRKKIDGLKFSELAKYILEKTCLDRETVQFMGIPLHLFIIGSIYFDSNFKLEINSGIYSIYSKFIDLKIRIYVEEKQGIWYQGSGKEIIIRTYKTNADRIHIDLANQLMDKGRIEINSKEDEEFCASLGIAFIKGEQIDFLHHTFAEYFRAESIRKDLKKDEFMDVLFEDKYEVVRRFLVSSLEEKKFENLTKEFFEDLEFIFSVLERFLQKSGREFRDYESNLKFDTIARIVKCLMESFENTVDLNSLNKFVSAIRSKLSSFYYWYLIGGCLTVKMVKLLFNQSNDDLKLKFGVVAYYSNPEEIIELLSECISIENSGECDSNEREKENRKAESLLKVMELEDSNGHSLLTYAALNERIETIPKIMEFSRNSLGEELFVNEIIGSEEYKEVIVGFINNADFNRICGFLKTFHSVFGKEIDIFFNDKLKFRILKKTLKIELSNEFEEIINLFKEYFGNEKVKEVLFICDSDGYYLIHILVQINKNVIENLNIIRNILVDSEMKQFLMFKKNHSENIFHFAAKYENVNFGDLLEFCNNYLEKHEILELLTICGGFGVWNALNLLFGCNSLEILIECLDVIKNTLDNDELFKQLLKGEDKYKWNIFHFAAVNENEIDISILSSYLCENEIKELLIGKTVNGETILHFGVNSHSRNLLNLFEYSFETLKADEGRFEELIMATSMNDGYTFLHQFVQSYDIDYGEELVINLIKSLKERVSEDIFKELIRIRNKTEKTFLQVQNKFRKEFNERVIKCCKTILEENLIEELLKKNENNGEENDSDDEEHSDDDLLSD